MIEYQVAFSGNVKKISYQVAIRDSMIQFGLHLFLKRYRLKIEVFLRISLFHHILLIHYLAIEMLIMILIMIFLI